MDDFISKPVFKIKNPKECSKEKKHFFIELYEMLFASDSGYPKNGSNEEKFKYIASQDFCK